MHILLARYGLIAGLAGMLAALLLAAAGCTGTSSTLSSQVRFINSVPNGGNASFSANGIFAGNEPFFGQSAYETIPSSATKFSYTLSINPAVTFTSASTALVAGTPYTAIAMGRQGVVSTDARSPQIQVYQDDQTNPGAGNIRLRIIEAAPDLSAINVLVNNVVRASNISYPSIGTPITLPAGNLTIQAVQAVGGAAVTQPIQFTGIVAGHHYSAFVVEPTIAPTYNIELIDDTTNTLFP